MLWGSVTALTAPAFSGKTYVDDRFDDRLTREEPEKQPKRVRRKEIKRSRVFVSCCRTLCHGEVSVPCYYFFLAVRIWTANAKFCRVDDGTLMLQIPHGLMWYDFAFDA